VVLLFCLGLYASTGTSSSADGIHKCSVSYSIVATLVAIIIVLVLVLVIVLVIVMHHYLVLPVNKVCVNGQLN